MYLTAYDNRHNMIILFNVITIINIVVQSILLVVTHRYLNNILFWFRMLL